MYKQARSEVLEVVHQTTAYGGWDAEGVVRCCPGHCPIEIETLGLSELCKLVCCYGIEQIFKISIVCSTGNRSELLQMLGKI